MNLEQDWIYKDIVIRKRSVERMVSITDLWKAEGNQSPFRPDKWFKSELLQEKLEKLAIAVAEGVERDSKRKIIKVPGVLEVARGGRYTQGTFVSYDLAIDYTQLLSSETYKWFTSVLPENQKTESDDRRGLIELTAFEDANNQVRITPDGRISVYDGIAYTTGHKNPRDVWNELGVKFAEVVGKCDNFQFSGQGQRLTPVATLQVFLEILVLLPGRVAASIREKAVRTLIRAMNGDPTLVEEILDRIQDPQDLKQLENSIRLRRNQFYDTDLQSGTISNPLTEITVEIKNGYGWAKKTEEMTNLLVQLATHVGEMIIDRDSPHRPYSPTSKNLSRKIPLSLRTLRNMDVLHIYYFESSYIDDADVIDVFSSRAYPDIAYRDYLDKGVEYVVAHLVAPGGITQTGVERLNEIQQRFNAKYNGRIKLDAMRLDELVWNELYPAIEERYQDAKGKFGIHYLNRKIKNICQKLSQQKPSSNKLQISNKPKFEQLSLFGELLNGV